VRRSVGCVCETCYTDLHIKGTHKAGSLVGRAVDGHQFAVCSDLPILQAVTTFGHPATTREGERERERERDNKTQGSR